MKPNLRFSAPRVIDRFTLGQLSETQQRQFTIAGQEALGATDAASIFSHCEPEEMIWELFVVEDAETGKPLYDAWVLGTDSGSVFDHGTDSDIGISLIQTDYADTLEEGDDTESRAELVEALNDAYCEASHFDDEPGAWDAYWEEFNQKAEAADKT